MTWSDFQLYAMLMVTGGKTPDYAVRYSHPSSRLQFRKAQRVKLTAQREPGPPGRRVYVKYDLISDPDVEGI
jgi:hypothetical protein